MKWLARWVVIMVVAVPFWWLLIDADRGTAPPKPIHIAELRMLAAILPGRRPTAVTYTLLATRKSVGDYYAAGTGLKRRHLAVIAWTLPVPGQAPIMIDPAAPPPAAGVGRFADIDQGAQRRVGAQARTASLVLATQTRQGEAPLPVRHLGKAGVSLAGAARNPAALPIFASSYTTARAVAPGVVVIPASSHAPGAQLIFVQLADGREFLFAGAIAPLAENWTRLRARSHLAAIWGPAQDRAQTYAWLRTIRQLRSEAPRLKVVPGDDYLWLVVQRAMGTVAEWHADHHQTAAAPHMG